MVQILNTNFISIEKAQIFVSLKYLLTLSQKFWVDGNLGQPFFWPISL